MSDQNEQVVMNVYFKHLDGFEEKIKLEGTSVIVIGVWAMMGYDNS